MNIDLLREKVLVLVRSHFPNENCGPTVVIDLARAELEPEMSQIQASLAGKSWQEIDYDRLPRPIDSILLLSEMAFQKLFPAYIAGLCRPDALSKTERREVCDIIRWSIPERGNAELESEVLREDWWNALTDSQRAVVQLCVILGVLEEVPFPLNEFLFRWADWLLGEEGKAG